MRTVRFLSVVLAIALVFSLGTNVLAASLTDELSDREIENGELSVKAAEEGMVLLQNNGILPLAEGSSIVLYGAGAVCTVKGGTGSGNVNQRSTINYYQGLSEVYTIANTDYLDAYQEAWDEAQQASETDEEDKAVVVVGTEEEEAKEEEDSLVVDGNEMLSGFMGREIPITDAAEIAAETDVDAAFYVVSRVSGEGYDRAAEEGDGDYYLSPTERANLELLCASYDHVVVLLNTANVIDTKFLDEIDGIDAVLLSCQGGEFSGTALANILTGAATPSGKLVDTWPVDYTDFPSSATLLKEYVDSDFYDEYYYEGIYVGYRYFDTFGVEPMFAFGYGLSYTSFDIQTLDVDADSKNVTVTVKVSNTGSTYSGKEVVQIYFSAPDGMLDKPYQELAAYAKTELLAPGESQVLRISFATTDMSSYSEELAAYLLEDGEYIVRVGNSSRNTHVAAILALKQDVLTEQLSNQLSVEEEKAEKLAAGALDTDSAIPYTYDGEAEELARAQRITLSADKMKTENNASALDSESVITYYSENDADTDSARYYEKGGWTSELAEETFVSVETDSENTLLDVYQENITMEQFVAGLSVEKLSYIVNGIDADSEYGVDYAAANELSDMVYEEDGEEINAGSAVGYLSHYVPGAVWASCGRYYNTLLIPSVNLSDGPAGLRLTKTGVTDIYQLASPVLVSEDGTEIESEAEITVLEDQEYYQYMTAWPVGVMLAQMWNPDLVQAVAKGYGAEMEELHVTYLLGPGMNIHRTPLCGRNFEYYSEDPVVTGITALNMTLGIQSCDGLSVTLKHFAGNNNESGRIYVNDVVSERALREIYLKGFEIAVKGAAPGAVMTSYNLINGTYTVNSYDLVTDILRGEWNYQGTVMSDYFAAYNAQANETLGLNTWANVMHSGNDWIMGGSPETISGEDSFSAQIIDGETITAPLGDLQDSAIHILNGILQSDMFGDTMADWVDSALVSAEDIAALQQIHNGAKNCFSG